MTKLLAQSVVLIILAFANGEESLVLNSQESVGEFIQTKSAATVSTAMLDNPLIQPDRIILVTGSPVKKPTTLSMPPAGEPTRLPKTRAPSRMKQSVSPARTPTRAPTSAPVYSTDYSCVHANAWLVNQDNQYSNLYGTKVDIISSAFTNASVSTTGWKVSFNGIPFYGHVFTQEEIDTLNSRPKAATDFTTGQTTAVAGTYYDFGANIGYASTKCTEGYWPTGPDCPVSYSGTFTFPSPASPEASSSGCYIPMHMGYFVNGVPFWSWSDAETYNDEGVWYNAAMSFEQYDMDVCRGHSGSNVYHHHSVSPCLMTQLNDTGHGHSPVHGFAYDGYPIYGPYQAANTLAVSCWKARDYSSSEVGCAGGGRTCQLVDAYDYTKGTFTVASPGPNPNGTVETQSSNTISAASGCYFEDYFLDPVCTARGGQYLDSHNGHSHGSYGYHYHLTMDSSKTPTFPYTMGPKYYGCHDSACDTSPYGSSSTSSPSQCTVAPTQKAGTCTRFLSSPAVSYPTFAPTVAGPTAGPSVTSTAAPSVGATTHPTRKPTESPSVRPSFRPTWKPTPATNAASVAASADSIDSVLTELPLVQQTAGASQVAVEEVKSDTSVVAAQEESVAHESLVELVQNGVRKLLRGLRY